MKRKLVMMALIFTVAFSGCGNTETQQTQETTAQAAGEIGEQEAETEEAETEEAETEETEAEETETEETETEEAETEETETEETKAEENVEEPKAEKVQAESEAPSLPEYTVTPFAEAKVMYASNPVNVRKGPTTDYERVGGLNGGQEVSVTGQADTGWYEIAYGEEKAYVSDRYLQDEKPAEQTPQQAANEQGQAVTEVRNVAGVILVGDSRFVQMQQSVGANSCTWIAENAKGYKWLNETAMARIDSCVGKGSKILINLGVNDPGNVNNYLALINAKAAEWVSKGATVYYASVNPVWENPYVTEEQVHSFNSQMQGGLSSNVHWIDSHSYIESVGYKLVDGLHYNAETYQNLYAYFMSCL